MIKSLIVIVLLCGSLSMQNDDSVEYSVAGHNKKVVCYWGTWANYRNGAGKFTPEDIDANLCTHLIYSFAGLNPNTSSIMSLDPWLDLEDDYGLAGFRKATDLKIKHPGLKVTLAIGGWNEGSVKYSTMAKNATSRATFVKSTILFLVKHKFDGLDIDWEYPGKRGGLPEDKVNFIALIRDLRRALDVQKMILTAAIGASPETIETAYDVPQMYKYLDFVHVMCYDYHGQWDKKTGHNAPLYPRPDDDKSQTVDATVKLLLRMGALREKTVLGLAFYGRAFLLLDPRNNQMNADAAETSFSGQYTREDGFMGFNEICEELNFPGSRWIADIDPFQLSPYMWNGRKWISYDDEQSLRRKSEYAYDFDLAGVMIWSIDTDDFTGTCTGQSFPLLRAINNALFMRSAGITGQRRQRPTLVAARASTLVTSSVLIVIATAITFFNLIHPL